MGALVGALVFFALPSSLQGEKRKARQTYELMQEIRLRSVMQRRIFGLDVPDEERILQVVVLDSGGAAFVTSAPVTGDDAFAESLPGNADNAEEDEKPRAPTAAERKQLAASLGLIGQTGSADWKLAENYDAIDFGEGGITFFAQTEDTDLARRSEEIRSNLAEELGTDEESPLSPELVFFPDGKLSAPGSLRLISGEDNVIYAFSWDTAGNFELEKQ